MTVDRIIPDEPRQAVIAEALAAPYPVTLEGLAAKLGVTALEAARMLPKKNCAFVQGDASERFGEIWEGLCAWERATLFIVHLGHVFEIEAKLSPGKIAQGYYNILHSGAIVGGHLRCDSLGAAAFLSMPFMKRESHCVVFFDKNGAVAFSVYAGRENHRLIDSVVEAFQRDRARLCAG